LSLRRLGKRCWPPRFASRRREIAFQPKPRNVPKLIGADRSMHRWQGRRPPKDRGDEWAKCRTRTVAPQLSWTATRHLRGNDRLPDRKKRSRVGIGSDKDRRACHECIPATGRMEQSPVLGL